MEKPGANKKVIPTKTIHLRKKEQALVIGAGIIGLTTAIKAQKAGYQVRIVAEKPPLETTSVKAGAVFEPYQPGNISINDMIQFVKVGLYEYEQIIDHYPESETGLRLHDLYTPSTTLIDPSEIPFLSAIPQWKLITKHVPGGKRYKSAMLYKNVPMIDPTKALPFLVKKFIKNGGEIEAPFQKITNLFAFINTVPEKIIFNCTGLGAKELLGDHELQPMRGQIVVLNKRAPWDYSILGDDVFYIFPRSNTTILGGTTELGKWDEGTTQDSIEKIIATAQEVMHIDPKKDILQTYAGLRPYRESGAEISIDHIRGKKHIRVVGFGGSGWTFNWGAAEKAVAFATGEIE